MIQPLSEQETLDLSGLQCPLPILRTKKALQALNTREIIKIICTDPAAPNDLAEFCVRTGNVLVNQWQDGKAFFFLIQKR